MEGADVSPTASKADAPIADVDAWLRRHLGRQLIVALVSLREQMANDAHRLAEALAEYGEIRVLEGVIASGSAAFLQTLVAVEPEIVLVWVPMPDGEDASAPPAAGFASALRRVLDDLEARGVCDRAFVAVIGPGVTRQRARRLGFEDGFPARTDPAELAAALAHEGVAVDERRRRGSSPPCYL